MREREQLDLVQRVMVRRAEAVETRLAAARRDLAAAEHECRVCAACVRQEEGRLSTLVGYLAAPDVAGSATRYAELLSVRDVVARDLGRERYVLERAMRDCAEVEARVDALRAELARARFRVDALQARDRTLVIERRRRLDDREEQERDDQVASGSNRG